MRISCSNAGSSVGFGNALEGFLEFQNQGMFFEVVLLSFSYLLAAPEAFPGPHERAMCGIGDMDR
jgi:hypothetical protein